MSAASKVFGNALLVEQILLQNPSPADITRARGIDSFVKATIDNSRALRRILFLEPELATETRHYSTQTDTSSHDVVIIKLHPSLGIKTVSLHGRFYVDKETAKRFNQPGQWRSMFICQPPCSGFRVGSLESQGSTLGDLMDAIEKHQGSEQCTEPKVMFEIVGPVAEERSFLGQKAKASAIRLKREAEAAKIKNAAVKDAAEAVKKVAAEEVVGQKIAMKSSVADAEKNKKAATAAARVFGVVELLEQIFENLAPSEITRARQLNKHFKTTIDDSLPLQRGMFLKSEPAREIMYYGPEDLELFWTPGASDDGSDSDSESTSSEPPAKPPTPFTVVRVHPAISALDEYEDGLLHFKMPKTPWMAGMWQKMLICQPPCQKFRLDAYVWRGNMLRRKIWVTHPFVGNTLGALVSAVAGLERGVIDYRLTPLDGLCEEEGTEFVRKARDKVFASKLADQMVALCKARNEDADEGVSEDLDKRKGSQSKITQNRFGKPSMI